ncbi:hypothetical protein BBJ28_00022173 [Nothophytophthora sp. Chile5]|nr:hypothetical protein BBJ28_00022173 [Nothophytophthora sp. Chile5]
MAIRSAMSRHLPAATDASAVDRLKAELKRTLHKRVAESVDAACGAFEEELDQAAQPLVLPQFGAMDYDFYYDCCRRLVEYIVKNMDTSPQFGQQMDSIILACHSCAPEPVLSSVVKTNVWFHRRVSESDAGSSVASSNEGDAERTTAPFVSGGVLHLNRAVRNRVVKSESLPVRDARSQRAPVAGSSTVDIGPVNGPMPSHSASTANGGTHLEVRSVNGATLRSGPSVASSANSKKAPTNAGLASVSAAATPLPRQWGNRKRLSTRTRSGSIVSATKRRRRAIVPAPQCTEESSTEEEEEGEFEGKLKEGHEAITLERAQWAKSVAEDDTEAEGDVESGEHGEEINTAEEVKATEHGQLDDVVHIEMEMRQMEHDLEAGDEEFGLIRAKTAFRTVLTALRDSDAESGPSYAAMLASEYPDDCGGGLSLMDPIRELCDAEHRSPEQTKRFKMRLRDTIPIVDAILCKPPPGQICSRSCKKIRAQMCNSFEPCRNPMCRIWHDAEAHSEGCQNPQCEFKGRVMLRETLHEIEQKQLEIVKVRDTLRRKRTHLLTVMDEDDGGGLANPSTLANEVDQLVRDLHSKEGDLVVLKDTQKTHCAVLERIGSDWNAEVVDTFPDFATHYVNKIPRKRKPKDTGTMHN